MTVTAPKPGWKGGLSGLVGIRVLRKNDGSFGCDRLSPARVAKARQTRESVAEEAVCTLPSIRA